MKKWIHKPSGQLKAHDVSISLLKANDLLAEMIRQEMDDRNILLINLVSSPGSGKTSLLEETIRILKNRIRIAVLEGDLETERDAERIKRQGVQAFQIVTGGTCHLEAQMVKQAMTTLDLSAVDILFIENVGNLVCPASYDLGEDLRVALVSCTEGEDKPKKYPGMFLTTDILLITKTDLLPYVPFSMETITNEALEVNGKLTLQSLSSLTGKGMDLWCDLLLDQLEKKRERALITI